MERGEFDNLSGKGKPLDLDEYFATPEDMRMAFALLKSNDYLPEEVEIHRDIAVLKEKLKASDDEIEKQALTRSINDKVLSLTIILETRKRKK